MSCITSNNQQLGIMTNITLSDDEYDHDNGEQDDDYYTSSTTTITMDHANRDHVFSKVEDTSSSVTTCACTLDNNSERCGSVTACSLDGSGTSHSMGSSSGGMRNRSNNRNHGRAGGGNVAAAATAASEAKAAALTLQVESLRQQLAERDATVNELQRQIQQDRRNHEKLLQRWNLFFGSTTTSSSSSVGTTTTATTTTTMRNRNTTVSPSTSSPRGYGTSPTSTSSSTTVMTSAELQRIHDHMDQLEREKDIALQKAVQLSVALAESRAKVSTLESQLEESNNILQMVHHNQSHPFLLGFAKRKTPVAASSSAAVGTLKMQQHHETLVESSDPPITDIQLDDDDYQHDDPNTDERMTMMLTLDDPLRFVEEDMSLESESISSWSQRRCGHLSEHSDYSTSRRPIKATTRARRTAADDTMTNQAERGNSSSSNAYRLTSSLRGFLGSSLRNVTSSTTTTPAHT